MTYQNDASLLPHYCALHGSVLMIEVLCLDITTTAGTGGCKR